MPNPRTAAEWATQCYLASHRPHTSVMTLCLDCAESFARQQVVAFRERTIKQVEAYLGVMYKAVPRDALKGYLIDAIRAGKEKA